MNKIYISGPITGTEDFTERFQAAEDKMKDIFKGVDVVNPVKLCADLDPLTTEWSDYMDKCLEAMQDCDSIYMMKGWEDSKGAYVEHRFAKDNGLQFL